MVDEMGPVWSGSGSIKGKLLRVLRRRRRRGPWNPEEEEEQLMRKADSGISTGSVTRAATMTQVSQTEKVQNGPVDEKYETRLYVGNIDQRITESHLIKMFSPFGKIVSEDFLWHTRGPKRGEPRGYAFIEFSTREEAQLAKEKMNGRLACGRPLVVRFSSEKNFVEATNSSKAAGGTRKSAIVSSSLGQMSRSAKIAAIKNKLKAMEEENCSTKKPRPADGAVCSYNDIQSSSN